jgi:glycosyltransferase involved in cell wall biosynthesis
MNTTKSATVSIVIPVYNEAENVPLVYAALKDVWRALPAYDYEFIFVDDGSKDASVIAIQALSDVDARVRLVEFTRNFGKEMATTAGIDAATGDAVIMIDADLQHPPSHIPAFIAKWEAGAEEVIGMRFKNSGEGFIKKYGSLVFYRLIGSISDTGFKQGETDFRLIDRAVVDAYKELGEHQRMTRSLINWLGFRCEEVSFEAPARMHGTAQYSVIKLVRLAINSFLSHSLLPLRLAGYLGVTITICSGVLGVILIIDKYFMHDALHLDPSGPAQLAVLTVFLIGIVLASIGIIGLYVGAIHTEVARRPLYVVRRRRENKTL